MYTFNTWAIESIHSTVIYIQYNIYIYICYVQVEILYKLQLDQPVVYKEFVQVATCTGLSYKLQLVQNLYLCITYMTCVWASLQQQTTSL